METRLANLLVKGEHFIMECPEEKFTHKISDTKWSKKEILGHLVDSGINNLQRFTEIQFESKPYVVRKYNQDELVKANNYQAAEVRELLNLWLAINARIRRVMGLQTEKTLAYRIKIEDRSFDLKFLMEDYIVHLEHHLNQIMDPDYPVKASY